MKILIAEDEYTTRLMVQVSLENWGYSVISVVDGQEAMGYLEQPDAPDIAILDWEMPELDGVQVCRRVKELERETPIYVILLTARDSQNDILEGFAAGADDYMTKPFNDNELRARVRVAERMVRIQSSLARTVEELRQALDLVEELQATIPICTGCLKIAGEDGLWHSLDDVLKHRSDARFIQLVCPECAGEDS